MLQLEAIAEALLETVAGGTDWNQVGMQALYGGASGAGICAATGVGTFAVAGCAAVGAGIGAGLAYYSTQNQTTVKPANK